ncbi:LCP family protein [Paractinoplanes maris]|uniref:LCP family protein n=1 Tax=Paractinoplanes maris TaxID=1734446 RepID=UPI0020218370|nr:LCP family protein [Actinoplanes maris]
MRRESRFGRLAGWQKALLVLAVLLLVLGSGLAGGGFYLYSRYDRKVARDDLLPEATGAGERRQREQNWKSGPLNLLLLGSDSRAEEAGGRSPIGERSDTIMLVHVARSRDRATIVSIPRDSYVDVPAGGSWRGGKNKINAAFAFGGAKLTAATVSKLTRVPLDGAMIADFGGVHQMVDAVRGVNVCVPYDVRSTFSEKVWPKGCHDMDGDQAEEFMRQRYEVPGGDFGRMYNQQLVVKAVIAKSARGGLLTDPGKLDALLVTAADALTVDRSLDIRRLALTVRGIKPDAITYATVPHTSAGLKTRAGSAVQLDKAKSAAMFAAIRADTIDQWLAANPQKAPGS